MYKRQTQIRPSGKGRTRQWVIDDSLKMLDKVIGDRFGLIPVSYTHLDVYKRQAEQTVREWQESHPAGKKADCIRETGLSKPTVYKWWNCLLYKSRCV